MKVLESIIDLDMFGAPSTVNIKTKDKISSACGVIFSIAILCLVIALFFVFGADMIAKTNPNFSQYTLAGGLGNERVPFSRQDFLMAFGLYTENDHNYFYDPAYFTMMVQLHTDGKTIPLDTEPCEVTYQGVSRNATCIKDQQSTGPITIGAYSRAAVHLSYYRCINGTVPNVTCMPDEAIDAMTIQLYWDIVYTQSSVNPMNYHNPITLSNQSDMPYVTFALDQTQLLYMNSTLR